MNYVTYISTSVKLFDDDDLTEMLEQNHTNNNKVGITGILLYNKGTFFQVLEGDSESVNATFEKIQADPRHHNIIKLKTGSIAQRNFPDWSMGFTTSIPDSLSFLPGFIDPSKKDFLYRYNTDHPAVYLLRSFATTNNFIFQ